MYTEPKEVNELERYYFFGSEGDQWINDMSIIEVASICVNSGYRVVSAGWNDHYVNSNDGNSVMHYQSVTLIGKKAT